MKKVKLLIFALMALFLTTAAWVAADDDTGTVTVVHGVPGLTVDVYVNGGLTLPDFAPGTITDPLSLPEGTYDIEIYPAGADPSASAPAIAGSAFLPAGANASIVQGQSPPVACMPLPSTVIQAPSWEMRYLSPVVPMMRMGSPWQAGTESCQPPPISR